MVPISPFTPAPILLEATVTGVVWLVVVMGVGSEITLLGENWEVKVAGWSLTVAIGVDWKVVRRADKGMPAPSWSRS